VNPLVARRMVKSSRCNGQSGAPIFCCRFGPPFYNGDLRVRLAYKPPRQAHRSRFALDARADAAAAHRRRNTPVNLNGPAHSEKHEIFYLRIRPGRQSDLRSTCLRGSAEAEGLPTAQPRRLLVRAARRRSFAAIYGRRSVDRDIELPVSQPTMCAFAGEALDDLYVTAPASSLLQSSGVASRLPGAAPTSSGARGVSFDLILCADDGKAWIFAKPVSHRPRFQCAARV